MLKHLYGRFVSLALDAIRLHYGVGVGVGVGVSDGIGASVCVAVGVCVCEGVGEAVGVFVGSRLVVMTSWGAKPVAPSFVE